MKNSLSVRKPELIPEWSDRNLPLTQDMVNEKSQKTCGGSAQSADTNGRPL